MNKPDLRVRELDRKFLRGAAPKTRVESTPDRKSPLVPFSAMRIKDVIRIMFLRHNRRFEDGKEHRSWKIVDNQALRRWQGGDRCYMSARSMAASARLGAS
jgi:hypothetical protein